MLPRKETDFTRVESTRFYECSRPLYYIIYMIILIYYYYRLPPRDACALTSSKQAAGLKLLVYEAFSF